MVCTATPTPRRPAAPSAGGACWRTAAGGHEGSRGGSARHLTLFGSLAVFPCKPQFLDTCSLTPRLREPRLLDTSAPETRPFRMYLTSVDIRSTHEKTGLARVRRERNKSRRPSEPGERGSDHDRWRLGGMRSRPTLLAQTSHPGRHPLWRRAGPGSSLLPAPSRGGRRSVRSAVRL